jgi:hypothetical protein
MNQPHIIIGFSTPKNPLAVFSALIRVFEETPYSHTYIKIWSDVINGYIVYQESGLVMNAINGAVFDKKEKIFAEYKINVTEDQLSEIVKYSVDSLGIPYGVRQIAGMLSARVLRQLGFRNMKNPFADGPKTMVCSEFVGRVLALLGHPIDKDILEIEGPKMICRKASELYNKQRISHD